MSRHIILNEDKNCKYVFGWDPPLESFYLQVHNTTLPEDDDRNPSIILGTANHPLPELDDLISRARVYGCQIPHETQVKLYGERDEGI